MRLGATVLISCLAASSTVSAGSHRWGWHKGASWSGWGGNIHNNRWAPNDAAISSSTLSALKEHCKKQYGTGVSAAPTLVDGVAYYPTWSGLFVALDYIKCTVKWEINVTSAISAYSNTPATQSLISRSSPQIGNDGELYFTTLSQALTVAVDAGSGAVLGTAKVNVHPYAVVTMSPTYYKGLLIVGGSSTEEGAVSSVPGYVCCSFVGNVIALRFSRSKGFTKVWDIQMLPPPAVAANSTDRWSGASVWGSQPSIDEKRSQVFIGTGNVYKTPTSYSQCLAANGNGTTSSTTPANSDEEIDPCLPADVWQDSVLALDIATGKPNWVRQLTPVDSWRIACNAADSGSTTGSSLCPGVPGPDADFGMAPAFIPGQSSSARKHRNKAASPLPNDVVVLGQKNGNLFALDAANGSSVWSLATGPGGGLGGLSWGVAADNQRVYFTQINNANKRYTLPISKTNITNSAYGAVDIRSGKIVWDTPVPGNGTSNSPPTVAGDVVLVGMSDYAGGKTASSGGLVVLERGSGKVLGKVVVDNVVQGGVAADGDYVLFGSGYRASGAAANGSFYVFKV